MANGQSPDVVLERLAEGNRRYANNRAIHPHTTASRRSEVAGGQAPMAMVLGCSDSRVPPEIVFDCGLGDLFVVRTAGQVIDSAVLGSLEFGAAELHVPVLVVLGHQSCGAVKAALEAIEGNVTPEDGIRTIVEAIRPAAERSQHAPGDWLDNAVRANVGLTVSRLNASKQLLKAVQAGNLRIVGARYDLATGMVEMMAS